MLVGVKRGCQDPSWWVRCAIQPYRKQRSSEYCYAGLGRQGYKEGGRLWLQAPAQLQYRQDTGIGTKLNSGLSSSVWAHAA